MRKEMILWVTFIALLTAAGCDKSTSPPPSVDTSCRKLVQYCPTGYSWSSYVTDQASCVEAFNCVSDFYTGSCHDTLLDGFTCLGDVAGSGDCGDCDSIMSSLETFCTYPSTCL